MVDSWKETGAEVHKWLKNCAVSAPSIIASHKDGTTTTNYNEVMQILFDAWMPIFKQYVPEQAPKWDPFHRRYKDIIDKLHSPLQLRDFNVADLRSLLQRMSPKRAGGLDCWAVRELKCASDSTLQHICDLFQTIESTKKWPSAAEFGRIALIDKGEGPAIDAQRPLTILNLIYRLYAAFRLMDVSTWVRDWVHPSAGAAPGASVQGFPQHHGVLPGMSLLHVHTGSPWHHIGLRH